MLQLMAGMKLNGSSRIIRIALGTLLIACAAATWLADSLGIGRRLDPYVLLIMLGFGGTLIGVPIESWLEALRGGGRKTDD